MDKKKNFSTFSYKLVQISPIMILVNSGAFLSISSWFCELTELIFVMIPYISSTGCPPTRKGLWDMWKWRNLRICNRKLDGDRTTTGITVKSNRKVCREVSCVERANSREFSWI